jgi:hypothetical protein
MAARQTWGMPEIGKRIFCARAHPTLWALSQIFGPRYGARKFRGEDDER